MPHFESPPQEGLPQTEGEKRFRKQEAEEAALAEERKCASLEAARKRKGQPKVEEGGKIV